MKPADLKVLKARWSTVEGRTLVLEASRWLAGLTSRPSQVGEHDGRADLRGLPFPDPHRLGAVQGGRASFTVIGGFPKFLDARWHSIDLSGSIIRNARFVRAKLDDCLFDQANLEDWRLWNTTVINSSFVRADLRGSALGTGTSGYGGINEWVGCCFDRANLTGAILDEMALKSCTFRNAKLRRASFGYTAFDGVVFAGILDGVRFEARGLADTVDPGPMKGVDFSEAMFRDAYLVGYQFEDVAFSPDVLVIQDYPAVLSRALQLARASDDPDERSAIQVLEYAATRRSQRTFDSIFVPADFIAMGESSMASALVRLYERAKTE